MGKLIAGMTHKGFCVSDMEASLRFYCDCLGLPKMFEIKDDEGKDWLLYLKIQDREFIELFYDGKKKEEIDIREHICFEVEDIHAVVARVRECGYDTFNGMEVLHGKDNNYETFIQDPDGNLIELMQYTPEAMQFQ